MTDIVERLRGIVVERKVRGRGATITINQNITGWLEEAADEIERLRAQLAEYKFSPQFADELARQVDELEAENERLRECTP